MESKKMKEYDYFDMFGVDIENKLNSMLERVDYEDLGEITGGFFIKNEKMFFFYYYKMNPHNYINLNELLYDVIIIFDDIIEDVIEQEEVSEFSAREKIKNDICTEIYQMLKRYVKIKGYKDNFIKELKNYQGKTLYKLEIDDLVEEAYWRNFECDYENEIDEIDEYDVLEYNLQNKFEEFLNNIYLSIKVLEKGGEEEFLYTITEVDVVYHKNFFKIIEEVKEQE